jgi:hypothetical protein
MDPWVQTVISIASSIVSAVAVALLTVRLSLRQFYSQRWWERKADAYSVLVESLYHIKRQLEVLRDEATSQYRMPSDPRARLSQSAAQSDQEIRKAEGVGAFVISEAAAKSLSTLRWELDQYYQDLQYYQVLDKRLAAVDACLAKIRAIAMRELKVG